MTSASISPRRTAATAVWSGADADERGVVGLEPGLRHQVAHHEMRARARRGDADLHALEVGRAAIDPGLGRQHASTKPGIAAELDHRDDRLALGLHLDGVVERAGDDVGAAADQRLQRARAAGEIGNLDVQALVLEIAEPLGDRERQVEQRGLAADREPHLGLRAMRRARSAPAPAAAPQSDAAARIMRLAPARRVCVLDARPFVVVGDVLELGEVHAVVVRRPACRP